MDVTPVLEFLRKKIGLNPESVGIASVENAVRERINICGASSVADYLSKITGAGAELERLAEAVVISETSFFRNQTPFITLQNYLEKFVLHEGLGRPLRILCLPCSTGEEAFSIAMVLLDMGLSAQQFFIHAGDINEQSLSIAKAGSYSAYSFRGEDLAYQKKYFLRQRDHSYLLKQVVRDAVHFEQVNLLSENVLSGRQPYDVIFCRNLLIYFDEAAKVKATNVLTGHLAEQGILFVGHAEGAIGVRFGYVSLDYPMSFVFARKDYAAVINRALNINIPAVKLIATLSTTLYPVADVKRSIDAGQKKTAATALYQAGESQGLANESQTRSQRKNLQEHDIATATKLADQGLFSEAVKLCERMLFEGVESAQVYYLLGQMAASNGESLLAEEYLSKAIYLNADFYDALVSLSLLSTRMCKPDKAAALRRRAERVKQRNPDAAEK